MKTTIYTSLAAIALLVAAPANAQGPKLDLPAEGAAPASKTTLGGYGELHYNLVKVEDADESSSVVDLHRLVLFVGHRFTDTISFHSEIEVEHTLVAGGDAPGEVAIEQALIEWKLYKSYLTLRGGILLVPMGIVNTWHEPPIFNGVERPSVAKNIIPSTWREAGLGFSGELIEGLTYQLYLISGLDPLGFSSKSGIRGGRQKVAKANAKGLGVTGRLQYEPTLGVIIGLSGYHSAAGPNGDLKDADGKDIDMPVSGFSADVRAKWKGLEARAVAAMFMIGDTDKLRPATTPSDPDTDPDAKAADLGSQLFGAYVELGYNVLATMDTDHALVPFVRYETYDTLFAVEGREKTDADKARAIQEIVAGLTYRPVDQVVFKADVVLKYPGQGLDSTGFNLGIGFMF